MLSQDIPKAEIVHRLGITYKKAYNWELHLKK
jgi:hypothetical protein